MTQTLLLQACAHQKGQWSLFLVFCISDLARAKMNVGHFQTAFKAFKSGNGKIKMP